MTAPKAFIKSQLFEFKHFLKYYLQITMCNKKCFTCRNGQAIKVLEQKVPMGTSLVAQRLKHLPGMRETRVRSLGREVPLDKEMATHSSILAWKIPWTEKPGRLVSNFTFTFTLRTKQARV